MKMLQQRSTWGITSLVLLFVLLGTMNHSRADNRYSEVAVDTIKVEGGIVTVRVDEDGTISINGKQVEKGEGTFVYELRDSKNDFVLVRPGEGTLRLRSGIWPRGGMTWFERDDDDDESRGMVWYRDDDNETAHGELLRGFFSSDDDADAEWNVFVPQLEELEITRGLLAAENYQLNAEVLKLEAEARQLARQAQRAVGEEHDELENELKAKLEEIFAKKMERRKEVLDKLREELQENEKNYAARNAARSEMIERRLRELLGKDEEFKW